MVPADARVKLEQIRRKKNKNKSVTSKGVKDLRQLISSKKKTKVNDRSPNRVAKGRVTKNRPSSTGGSRDLRDTNKRLASRRNLSQTRDNRSTNRADRLDRVAQRPSKRASSNGGLTKSGKQLQQQQYYIPPHMQHQQPTYIFTSAPTPASNLAMDNVPEAQGASILISNLIPSITQSEIIELFGDIGVMTAVNMINSTTAMVTYSSSSDAVRAVKVYHNRTLDGRPMQVNMMPNPTPASNVRSRVGHTSIIGSHPVKDAWPMDVSYGGRRI